MLFKSQVKQIHFFKYLSLQKKVNQIPHLLWKILRVSAKPMTNKWLTKDKFKYILLDKITYFGFL